MTYEIEVPEATMRDELRAQLKQYKRVNLNPAVQGDWIQLRAQIPEFNKIAHLFEGLHINRYPLERNLREGLENIFDL